VNEYPSHGQPESGGPNRPKTTLAQGDDVVGDESAFTGHHESHGNSLSFEMMGLVKQVRDSHGRAKTQRRAHRLPGGTPRCEGAHQGIGFAQTLVQAALRGDSIGGDQRGQNAGIHFVLDRPERTRAGRIR